MGGGPNREAGQTVARRRVEHASHKLLTCLKQSVTIGGMSTVITNDQAKVNIGANVSRILDQKEWSQSDLARATGENVMTISHLTRGARLPSAALLARVAEALGVTSESLLSEPPERLPKKSA